MPDANGQFKGQGWSAKKAAAWERIFAPAPTPAPTCTPITSPLCRGCAFCTKRLRDNSLPRP